MVKYHGHFEQLEQLEASMENATYFVVHQHGVVFTVELFDASGISLGELIINGNNYFAFRATASANAFSQGYRPLPEHLRRA